jgi:hypothetical protein
LTSVQPNRRDASRKTRGIEALKFSAKRLERAQNQKCASGEKVVYSLNEKTGSLRFKNQTLSFSLANFDR